VVQGEGPEFKPKYHKKKKKKKEITLLFRLQSDFDANAWVPVIYAF
jgi:hypothetical protein